MADDITVGSVGVKIVPDARGWEARMEREFAKGADNIGRTMGRIIGDHIRDHMADALPEGINRAPVEAAARRKGTETGKSFAASMKNTLRVALKNMPEVKIDADSSAADLALSNIKIRMEALSKKTVGVDIDSGAAMAELESIKAELNRLGAESADIAVQMDTAGAVAELDKFKARIDRLKAEQAKIKVEADTARAVEALAAVGIEAEAVAAESPTVKVDADVARAMAELAAVGVEARVIGAETPTITPKVDSSGVDKLGSSASMATSHITVLVGAVAALTPLLVAVGAAATGAFAAIGAGAAAIGAGIGVAVLALKPVISAYQAISAAKDQQSAGKSSSQDSIASAQQQVVSAERTLANTRANVADQAEAAAQRVIQAKQSEAQAEREAARNITTAEEGVRRARAQSAEMQRQAASTLAQARVTAARQTQQAQQQVASARQQADQANRAAAQQEANAERNLQAAQESARQAQQNLTQSRKDAVEQLKQLQFQTEDAALSQRNAEYQVQETQERLAKTLADPNASWRDKGEAQLAYDQALQNLKEQTDAADELSKKNKAAQKAGVEGTDGVKNAKKAVADANQRVIDQQQALVTAQENVTRAQIEGSRKVIAAEKNVVLIRQQGAARIADAQRQLVKAQTDGAQQVADAERQLQDARVSGAERVRAAHASVSEAQRQQNSQARQGAFQLAQAQDGVVTAQRNLKKAYADAGGAGSESAKKVQDALAKLTPAGRDFLAFIMKAKGGFDELSRVAQNTFLPGLQRGLQAMTPLWKPFVKLVGEVGKAMGEVAEQAGKALGGPLGKNYIEFLTKNLGPWLKLSMSIIGNIVAGFIHLFEAFGPTATNFLKFFNSGAEGFNKWAEGAKKSKSFQGFLEYVNRVGPKVFKLIGEMLHVIGLLAAGLAPLGELVVDGLLALFTALGKLDPLQLTLVGAAIAGIIAALTGGTIAIIIAVVLAVAAAVRWFKELYDKDTEFRKSVDKTAKKFKKGFQEAWKVVGPIFKEAFTAINDNLIWAVKTLFKWLSKVPPGVWKTYFLILLGPLLLVAKAITFTQKSLKALVEFLGSPEFVAALKVAGIIISAPFVAAVETIKLIFGNKYVKKYFRELWNWVSGPFNLSWKLVSGLLTHPISTAKSAIRTLTSAKGIKGLFSGLWHWMNTPFRLLWYMVDNLLIKPVSKAFSAIKGLLGLKGIRSPFSRLSKWTKGDWARVWSGVTKVMTSPLTAAYDAIKHLLGTKGVRALFKACVDAIGRIWDRVGDKVAGPINYILGIFNWFARQFNKIGKLVGFELPTNLSVNPPKKSGGGAVGHGGGHVAPDRGYAKGGQVQPLPRRRDGGPIPGPWRGETADNVLGVDSMYGKPVAHVNPGEYITRVKSTRNMEREFPGYLDYINENGRPPGFAGGGLIGAGLPHFARGGFPKWGSSWSWQKALIERNFPGAVITSGYRPGARTRGSGATSYHAIGRAIDIGPGRNRALLSRIAKWILSHYGNASHDLLYSPLWGKMGLYEGGWYPQPASTVADHYNHVHWGLRLGGGKGGKGLLGKLVDGGKGLLGAGFGFLTDKMFSPIKKLFNSKLSGLDKFGSPFALKFIGGLAKKLLSSAISAAFDHDTGDGTGGLTVPANVTGAKAIGKNMAAQMGWTGAQWSALYKLWMGESGWNARAYNASSGATGIPQSLPGSKMASAGSDWRTNPATQIKWGLGYIKQVYGSPARAYGKWLARSPHWYAGGGLVKGNTDRSAEIWSALMQGDPDGDIARRAPVFDNGGTLARGLNLVNNQTGAPEHLTRTDTIRNGPAIVINGVKYDSANDVSKEIMYQVRRLENGTYGALL